MEAQSSPDFGKGEARQQGEGTQCRIAGSFGLAQGITLSNFVEILKRKGRHVDFWLAVRFLPEER
jgi:hypothetical protein